MGDSDKLSVFHPSDFSTESEVAFMHALKLALAGESRLTVLHTDAPGGRYAHWHDFPSVRDLLARWGLLDEGATRAEVMSLGVEVEKIELIGEDPVETMLDYLGRHPADVGAGHHARGQGARAARRPVKRTRGTPSRALQPLIEREKVGGRSCQWRDV